VFCKYTWYNPIQKRIKNTRDYCQQPTSNDRDPFTTTPWEDYRLNKLEPTCNIGASFVLLDTRSNGWYSHKSDYIDLRQWILRMGTAVAFGRHRWFEDKERFDENGWPTFEMNRIRIELNRTRIRSLSHDYFAVVSCKVLVWLPFDVLYEWNWCMSLKDYTCYSVRKVFPRHISCRLSGSSHKRFSLVFVYVPRFYGSYCSYAVIAPSWQATWVMSEEETWRATWEETRNEGGCRVWRVWRMTHEVWKA